jgi:hypothetical protein
MIKIKIQTIMIFNVNQKDIGQVIKNIQLNKII